jgi:hypothetical protein
MTSDRRYAARSSPRGPAYADSTAVVASAGCGRRCGKGLGARWRACRCTLRGFAARLPWATAALDFAALADVLRLTGTFNRACDASCAANGRATERAGATTTTSISSAHAAHTGSSKGGMERSDGASAWSRSPAPPNKARSQSRNRWRAFMVQNSLSPQSYISPHLSLTTLPSG